MAMARKMGMPLPKAIQDRPSILPGLGFIWGAFWDLSTTRAIGMTEGPIPWTAVNEYCQRHDIVGDEFDRFAMIIRALDAIYIEERNNKKSKPISGSGKKGKGHVGGRRK